MSTTIDKIKKIIEGNQLKDENFKNFVVQGGAGSGKTESLKEIISYISDKYPSKKIACITHTNVAVDEIKSRVGDKYNISTIHSFLNDLIKNYKNNLKSIIHNIFIIEKVAEETHETFKKVYGKYTDKLFSIRKESCEKVIGKREYDKSPSNYNTLLNEKIDILNTEIIGIIDSKDYNGIVYNETRFDSFKDLSFSHDSLLSLSYNLCKKYDLLPKIISDKYDFIFIDEYQDTNTEVIKLFLNLLPKNRKTTIGLFGDSMQGIYDDGIGDIIIPEDGNELVKINKEDNYRCSLEVIEFINIIRTDDIEQKLALKKNEGIETRKGRVKLCYSIYGKKPNTFSPSAEKDQYLETLNCLISATKEEFNQEKTKILMLTNKSISIEVGFVNLYNIFSDRYIEVKEEIEKELSKIQISDIIELCKLYHEKNYNPLLVYLKKNGFQIKSVQDKETISGHFNHLLNNDLNLEQVLDYSFENKLIKKSEHFTNYHARRKDFLSEYSANMDYKKWEIAYFNNGNTQKRLKDIHGIEISEEEFNDFENALKKKIFYTDLFSDKVKFKEVITYYKYLNEETDYITMHKTKGSGIENVIVILDEYFWNKYNFKSIYDDSIDSEKRYKNQKLFYVAASRTIKNLAIVRLIEDESEENMVINYFRNCEIMKK
jgi:DNA helicase-2/ATP-dependent DNA helicase PcrA